jgi:c-di-GMP-binding flagellar brake protein YcgR
MGAAAMHKSQNRRKYPRVEVEIQVTVGNGSESMNFKSETRDVSAGGVCVKLDSFVEAPTDVNVVLRLPDDQPPLETVGRVAWCVPQRTLIGRKHPAYETGISFPDLTTEQRERLIRFAQGFLY